MKTIEIIFRVVGISVLLIWAVVSALIMHFLKEGIRIKHEQ